PYVEAVVLLLHSRHEGLIEVTVLGPLGQQVGNRNRLLVAKRSGELGGSQVVIERIRDCNRSSALVLVNDARINLIVIPRITKILAPVHKERVIKQYLARQLARNIHVVSVIDRPDIILPGPCYVGSAEPDGR